MAQYRFVLVGTGWRARYYLRIAKRLPEVFECIGVLGRTKEKTELLAKEENLYMAKSEEECIQMRPDFVVVAVTRSQIATVSELWMKTGIPVLCETPAADDIETLEKLWKLHKDGGKLVVSEQYTRYPVTQAKLRLLEEDLIGDPQFLYLSMAHDYHGASLMRALLKEDYKTQFTVEAKKFTYPTVETRNRYENITDGRMTNKDRTIATFTFADGRGCLYDFDSEQYRSLIRSMSLRLQGSRGEMDQEVVRFLDQENHPHVGHLEVKTRVCTTESENVNLSLYEETESVKWICNEQQEELFTAPFGRVGLSDDECAICMVMLDAATYDKKLEKMDLWLRECLQDAYMSILLKEAVATGQKKESAPQIWQK